MLKKVETKCKRCKKEFCKKRTEQEFCSASMPECGVEKASKKTPQGYPTGKRC